MVVWPASGSQQKKQAGEAGASERPAGGSRKKILMILLENL
jgi:hypothetical protein